MGSCFKIDTKLVICNKYEGDVGRPFSKNNVNEKRFKLSIDSAHTYKHTQTNKESTFNPEIHRITAVGSVGWSGRGGIHINKCIHKYKNTQIHKYKYTNTQIQLFYKDCWQCWMDWPGWPAAKDSITRETLNSWFSDRGCFCQFLGEKVWILSVWKKWKYPSRVKYLEPCVDISLVGGKT